MIPLVGWNEKEDDKHNHGKLTACEDCFLKKFFETQENVDNFGGTDFTMKTLVNHPGFFGSNFYCPSDNCHVSIYFEDLGKILEGIFPFQEFLQTSKAEYITCGKKDE